MAKPSTYGKAHTLTLPSGIRVKARRPSIMSLIASGGFPSELTMEVWKLIKKDSLDPDKIAGDAEGIKAWTQLMDRYIPYVLTDPKVGEVTDLTEDEDRLVHGTVSMYDISDMDKQVIFLFGNNVCASDEELAAGRGVGGSDLVKALLEFRKGAASGDAGPGGEEVRSAPELNVGVGPEVAPGA